MNSNTTISNISKDCSSLIKKWIYIFKLNIWFVVLSLVFAIFQITAGSTFSISSPVTTSITFLFILGSFVFLIYFFIVLVTNIFEEYRLIIKLKNFNKNTETLNSIYYRIIFVFILNFGFLFPGLNFMTGILQLIFKILFYLKSKELKSS